MTEVAASDGYADLTVKRILTVARVSRATFYQYFSNVDDCFESAYRHHAAHLADHVKAAVTGRESTELAALESLATFTTSHPSAALLLMREGVAAGPAGLAQRDNLVANLEQATGGASRSIDLPPAILIGGTFRFLVMRLSDGSDLDGLAGDLREWAAAFPSAPSTPSWSGRLMPLLPDAAVPAPLGGTRPEGSARERILRATALSIRAKGYHAVTVTDIVGAAGISRRRFYNEFPTKADAFIATYEHGFQQTMAACAPAFFTAGKWRERVWQGALAFTGFLAREPLIAHLGFIECYAIGPGYTLRVHDILLAFTLFLEEGYRQRPEAEQLSRAHAALAATTIFETAFQASRRGPAFEIRRCQPLAVYVALAPFIGPEDAGTFVQRKLADSRVSASELSPHRA